jgi:hypothetical protein
MHRPTVHGLKIALLWVRVMHRKLPPILTR